MKRENQARHALGVL